MRRLIEADPRNREVIFPYIGGEEVNTSPTHAHHRHVINFRDWPLRRADRQAQASKTWTPGSADILSAPAGGPPWTTRRRPEIVPAGTMPAPPEQPPLLGRATGSGSRPTSSETGREAMHAPADRDRDDEARDERGSGDDVPVETASWAGATDAERCEWLRSGVVPVDYPGPVAADRPELLGIVEERVKPERVKNNRAGYRNGWTDISTDCDFLLDYEIDEATWGRKKKPYRYLWPDAVRDEVLARLLALNAERAAEEVRAGAIASA